MRISDDEWVRDEKTGEMRLSERGVTRQKEDILALAEKLGVDIVEWYEENDTTAFKKRRIRMPDGRSVWRVIRPEFRRMLADYEDGRIDGVIFYDLDRLARQPRDLEDLIDLAEYYKRPVATVTGELDLRTSNGRTMARVLVAMASKSSEDTSRRVARARLQEAQEGRNTRPGGVRRFGYTMDREIIEAEAELIREGARRILAGESWASLARLYQGSGILPPGGGRWHYPSVRRIYLSPTIAGIAMYNGVLRKENQEGRPQSAYADPESVALKDASGNFITSTAWEPILTPETWLALMADWKQRREGKTFSAFASRKYLLSGLLRCGRILPDGQMCNRVLVGGELTSRNGMRWRVYRCPTKTWGGCGGTTRAAKRMEPLIEDLLFAHIAANAPRDDDDPTAVPAPDDPDVMALADVQARLSRMRTGYAQGTVTDDTMFNVVPQLEARERKLKAALARKDKARRGRISLTRPVEDVRREWDAAADDVGVRRAILSRYLKAVIVRKSANPNTRILDYSSIEPVWRTENDPVPGEYLA